MTTERTWDKVIAYEGASSQDSLREVLRLLADGTENDCAVAWYGWERPNNAAAEAVFRVEYDGQRSSVARYYPGAGYVHILDQFEGHWLKALLVALQVVHGRRLGLRALEAHEVRE